MTSFGAMEPRAPSMPTCRRSNHALRHVYHGSPPCSGVARGLLVPSNPQPRFLTRLPLALPPDQPQPLGAASSGSDEDSPPGVGGRTLVHTTAPPAPEPPAPAPSTPEPITYGAETTDRPQFQENTSAVRTRGDGREISPGRTAAPGGAVQAGPGGLGPQEVAAQGEKGLNTGQRKAEGSEEKILDAEILGIAWPMLLTLAADPIAGLVDTAFMGRLGAAQLAGVGVALSIFNTITKMFNVPLLSVTTSAVASSLGSSGGVGRVGREDRRTLLAGAKEGEGTEAAVAVVSEAACASIGIALAVGVVQVLLLSQSSSLLSIWGVGSASPLMQPTLDFLGVRCLGAPITVLMLCLQGVFRGLQDTRAPLAATVASNALNLVLAPILIFGADWGVKGAAIATVASQLLPCLYLLHLLSRRLSLRLSSAGTLAKTISLLKPTGLLVLRTMAISITYATATSTAARSNVPAAAAAHQVSFQVYMALSLLADSLAVAAQALLASSLAAGQPRKARSIALRTLTLAAGLGTSVGVALAVGRHYVARAFTADPQVLMFIGAIMPLVVLGQPLNATAFTLDGVVFGAGGFTFSCFTAAAAAVPAWICMTLGESSASASTRLLWVWVGLLSLMAVRAGTLGVALLRGLGPFARMPPDSAIAKPKQI